MTEVYEPQNAAADVHRQIAEMRAVNQGLRSSPYNPAPDSGPLTDEDYIRQFAVDTGWIIDQNGNKVGEVPGWVPPGTPGRRPDGTATPGASVLRNAQDIAATMIEREEPVFGRQKSPFVPGSRITLSQITGVDLQAGEVLVDGYRWPMLPAEREELAKYCVKVMVRALNEQIQALQHDEGIADPPPHETDKQEGENADVPAVPPGRPPSGAVPRTPGKPKRKAAVVPPVRGGAPTDDGGGGGGPAEVPPRDAGA